MPRKPKSRNDEGKTVFQERLRDAMVVRHVPNNAALARALKMNPQTTEKWINGKTKFIRGVDLFKLGDALNVSPKWLLGLSDDMAPGRKLDPDRRRALDLYDQLEKLGGEWLDDWIADGHRTLEKVKKMPSIAAPFARR